MAFKLMTLGALLFTSLCSTSPVMTGRSMRNETSLPCNTTSKAEHENQGPRHANLRRAYSSTNHYTITPNTARSAVFPRSPSAKTPITVSLCEQMGQGDSKAAGTCYEFTTEAEPKCYSVSDVGVPNPLKIHSFFTEKLTGGVLFSANNCPWGEVYSVQDQSWHLFQDAGAGLTNFKGNFTLGSFYVARAL